MKVLVDLYATKAALELEISDLDKLAVAIQSCRKTLQDLKENKTKTKKVVWIFPNLDDHINLDDYIRSLPHGTVAVNLGTEPAG